MSALLRKYGVQTDIYFPLIKAASNNFAVSADYTHSSGDVKVSKDGGAAATATNSPSAITMGNGAMWKLTLTATEMQAAKIVVTIIDASTKAVEDQMIEIETYGNASGEHAFDLDTALQDVNVLQISGDSTAADNAEAMFDGAGYVGGTIRLKTDGPARKNIALSNFTFAMIDAADDITGKTGLTVTATISKDGGAFAACTNAVSEIANGLYKINLTAAEMNADIIILKFTATGANSALERILTTP